MQPIAVDQLVGQALGNYRLERFLGKGRLSAVFLARHLSSSRVDALTLYFIPEQFSNEERTRFVARFRHVVTETIALKHEHILPINAFGEYMGLPYLVTPYMTHGSLADVIKRKGRCDHMYVSNLLQPVVSGLSYAHSQRSYHGTLKPGNILLDERNSLQVAGFGLLQMFQRRGVTQTRQSSDHLFSVANTLLVDPAYLAPEIIEGKAPDHRSDVYALGCIIYELLAGRTPFVGDDPLALARLQVTGSIPALRTLATDIPVVLGTVVRQALERDPDQRFQQIDELYEAFMQASSGAISFNSAKQPAVQPGQRITSGLHDHRANDEMGTGKQPSVGRRVSDNWQFVPPIVSGKLPVVRASTPPSPEMEARNINTSGSLPVPPPTARPAAGRDGRPRQKQRGESSRAPRTDELQEMAQRTMLPETPEDEERLIQDYAWWSYSEQVSTKQHAQQPRKNTNQEQVVLRQQAAPANMQRVAPQEPDWSLDNFAADASRKPSGGRKWTRRGIIFALVVGGAAAVAGEVTMNMHNIVNAFDQDVLHQKPGTNTKATPATTQPANTMPAKNQPAKNTGK